MLTTEQIDRLLSQGANVLSGDGEKIGSIGQVFVDNEDGQPSWVTVRTGLFGMSESFVPLEGAREEGNDIVVPYSKSQVKDAPRIDADRALEPAEEDRLYQHYQLDIGRTYSEATPDGADSTPVLGTERTATPATTGYAPATDYAQVPAAQETTATDRGAPEPSDAVSTSGYDTTAPAAQDTAAPSRTTAGEPSEPPSAATYDTTAPATDETRTPVAQETTATDRGAPEPSDALGTSGYDTTAPAAPSRTTAGEPSEPPSAATYDTTAPATDETRTPVAQETTVPSRTSASEPSEAPGAPSTGDAGYDITGTDRGAPEPSKAPSAPGTGDAGYDTSAPATDDTKVRSQPRPDAGAEQPAGQGRLRKYVTTEYVTRTVPVQREEVRVEREPIAEENRGEVADRADDENEVILHEERIIVTKETVPVERVRIGTETVTEDVTIKEKVRKEHLDTDGPEESHS
ncbi:DUF2382 domain-containing protein [Arthrobacter sp. 2MCAF15]|uniref:PRC and DUF2382 domain-containing protein n=1 Tax=Arthrobacter sp. 2MCAF15 TaxID=3232984 RepID=UPI003F92C248